MNKNLSDDQQVLLKTKFYLMRQHAKDFGCEFEYTEGSLEPKFHVWDYNIGSLIVTFSIPYTLYTDIEILVDDMVKRIEFYEKNGF